MGSHNKEFENFVQEVEEIARTRYPDQRSSVELMIIRDRLFHAIDKVRGVDYINWGAEEWDLYD